MVATSIDITGHSFGRLKALRPDNNKFAKSHGPNSPARFRPGYWECECVCGNLKSVRREDLVNNKVISCGCFKSERDPRAWQRRSGSTKRPRRPQQSWKKSSNPATIKKQWLRVYRYGAANRDLDFVLSPEQAYSIAEQNCIYCGATPPAGPWPHNGIDRADNDLGYTPDNSVPCCSLCNRMKGGLSSVDFVDQSHRISAHHGKPLQKVSHA